MKILVFIVSVLSFGLSQADTMANYMNLSNQIPQMEMKADTQSQAWARNARSVISLANESIVETLLQINETAKEQGHALFCLPEGVSLTASNLHELIVKTYTTMTDQLFEKEKMTVSKVALMGIRRTYPCEAQTGAPVATKAPFEQSIERMEHIE